MRTNHTLNRTFLLLVLTFLPSTPAFAQEPTPPTASELRALLKLSHDKDTRVKDKANEALSKLDARAPPAVTEILGMGNTCERLGAAQLLFELESRHLAHLRKDKVLGRAWVKWIVSIKAFHVYALEN